MAAPKHVTRNPSTVIGLFIAIRPESGHQWLPACPSSASFPFQLSPNIFSCATAPTIQFMLYSYCDPAASRTSFIRLTGSLTVKSFTPFFLKYYLIFADQGASAILDSYSYLTQPRDPVFGQL
jgi:hypothetical protein